MKYLSRDNRNGSILILAIWVLSLLTIFAVHIGLKVRQRATLLSRLESRSDLHYIVDGGIKKAIAALRVDLEKTQGLYSSDGKAYRHNNEELFRDITVGDGVCDVYYPFFDGRIHSTTRYGVLDEESKININVADISVLKRLIQRTAFLKDEEAASLAAAIISWREMGEKEATGFYSDDYYTNLQYPYESKNAEFELPDELRLVKGFTPEIYNRIMPFITVFGDGKININTASREVFLSLGFSEALADKILLVRRGADGVEATLDDYIFQKTFDIASEILSFVELEIDEIKQIDLLNSFGLFKTYSLYFMIEAHGQFDYKKGKMVVASVYNAKDNRVEYWRQKR